MTEAYLYSMVISGEFRVFKGFIEVGNPNHIPRQLGFFHFGKTRVALSVEPGEIFNRMLWLPERDDQKARELFIEDYNRRIDKLNTTIRNYQNAIETCKKEVEYLSEAVNPIPYGETIKET